MHLASGGSRRPTPRRVPVLKRLRRRWLLVVTVLVVLGGLGAWGAVELTVVAGDLREAEALVDDASEALRDGRLADARGALEQAEGLVLEANEGLRGSLPLDAVGWVPGVRQNLQSLQDSVELATIVVHGGGRVLSASSPLESAEGRLEVSISAGRVPLESVTLAQDEIDSLSAQLLPVVRRQEPSLLLPPVEELRRAVYDEALDRADQLEVLGHGLELLRQMSGGDGPRRYLLAVANTAEMRGSGGMILSYGVLEGRDGVLDLVAFGDIDELAVPGPVSADLAPADYVARWGGFDPLSRFRQANLSGDFTVIAPVLEALYSSASGLPVNGVIQVDPHGLAAILEGVGPVVVPEVGEVRADNVVEITLNTAYFQFPDVEQRTDVLGDVAEAAFRRLVDGDFPSLRPLATALVGAVDGRHLLMRDATSSGQASVTAFGADGAYPPVDGPDAVALTVQNLAGNKLDYYLDTSLRLTGERPVGELGTVEAEITLSNGAPAGLTAPTYIFGPGPGTAGLPAGTLRSLVTLYLPLGATLEGAAGDATVEPASSGTEDGRPYVSFIVDVPAADARTVSLTLQLAPRADGDYQLLAIPSPRVRPTTFAVDLRTEAGTVEGAVELDRPWTFSAGAPPVQLPAPAFR